MASEGPLSPGTLADDNAVGTLTWSNPSNAASSNDSHATIAFTTNGEISHYLKATNFGFAIPAGATINGIVVEIERKASNGTRITDNRVRIVKGGTVGSTDKASATFWPTSDTVASYGSSSDLWGETWTVSDINASNFGVVVAADTSVTSAITASIDHIKITVHYTPAASGFTGWGVSM